MKFFIVACALVACTCAEFDMQGSFNLIDADMNGMVSQAEFDALYSTFDDDADTFISGTEFVTHFTKTGMSVQGSLYVFFLMDVNHDQNVNKSEVDMMFNMMDSNMDMSISYLEYASSMNVIANQLVIAASAQPSLGGMFDGADMNGDGMLTSDEASGLLGPADKDGNNMISQMEFVTYWRNKTMDSQTRAEIMFSILDFDMSGEFGSDLEKSGFFTGFDYGKDGTISKEEYQNSMLSLFARVMTKVNMGTAMSTMMNKDFDASKAFKSVDTNMDGMISTDEFKMSVNMSNTNGDDHIDIKEFLTARIKAGMTQTASLYMFFQMDLNHDNMLVKMENMHAFHMKDRNMDMHIDMEEFMHSMDMLKHVMGVVTDITPKVANMLYAIDMNGDAKLSRDEMLALFTPADTNMDHELSKAEFVKYWSEHTGLPERFSQLMYDHFDSNMDDKVDDAERKHIFTAFDNDKNDVVTFEEFSNAMLYIFADIVGKMQMEIKMKLQGTFNITSSFDKIDTNMNNMLEKSETDTFFKNMDTDGNMEWSAEEVIAGYVADGFDATGAIYILFRADSNDDNKVSQTELTNIFGPLDVDGSGDMSRDEYNAGIKRLLHQLQEASVAGHKLSKLFDHADMDMSGNLTSTEMKAIFTHADSDMDGLVSEAEFKKFWMMKTGEPSDRTEIMFGLMDSDDDGMFGNDQETVHLFDGFDYVDDDVVTKEEFLNSLLHMYAETVEITEMKKKAADVVGFFF